MKASFSHCQLSLFEGRLARIHVGEIVSRKMDGEACPADGFGTRSFEPGSFSDRPRGTDSPGFIFAT